MFGGRQGDPKFWKLSFVWVWRPCPARRSRLPLPPKSHHRHPLLIHHHPSSQAMLINTLLLLTLSAIAPSAVVAYETDRGESLSEMTRFERTKRNGSSSSSPPSSLLLSFAQQTRSRPSSRRHPTAVAIIRASVLVEESSTVPSVQRSLPSDLSAQPRSLLGARADHHLSSVTSLSVTEPRP